MYSGVNASDGIGIGVASVAIEPDLTYTPKKIDDTEAEAARYEAARKSFMEMTDKQIANMKAKGLEKDIVKWLRSNDTLRTIKEFKERFPDRSEDEIREAIERLCKERILYGAEFIVGEMYGLAGPQK